MWKKMLVMAGLMGLLLCGNLARAQESETTTPKIIKPKREGHIPRLTPRYFLGLRDAFAENHSC